MDHGTKDPKTGNELTYEVNQPGVEDKEEEEEEDTVFSEEEQRLVKESVQRMHERLLSKKRLRRPNEKKRRQSQHNIERQRDGSRGRISRRVGFEGEGFVAGINQVAGRGMAGIRRVGLPVQHQGF